jgi:hypothetical protein
MRWIGRSTACPPWRGRCYFGAEGALSFTIEQATFRLLSAIERWALGVGRWTLSVFFYSPLVTHHLSLITNHFWPSQDGSHRARIESREWQRQRNQLERSFRHVLENQSFQYCHLASQDRLVRG